MLICFPCSSLSVIFKFGGKLCLTFALLTCFRDAVGELIHCFWQACRVQSHGYSVGGTGSANVMCKACMCVRVCVCGDVCVHGVYVCVFTEVAAAWAVLSADAGIPRLIA